VGASPAPAARLVKIKINYYEDKNRKGGWMDEALGEVGGSQ